MFQSIFIMHLLVSWIRIPPLSYAFNSQENIFLFSRQICKNKLTRNNNFFCCLNFWNRYLIVFYNLFIVFFNLNAASFGFYQFSRKHFPVQRTNMLCKLTRIKCLFGCLNFRKKLVNSYFSVFIVFLIPNAIIICSYSFSRKNFMFDRQI